jgi:hypothetical protein
LAAREGTLRVKLHRDLLSSFTAILVVSPASPS